MLANNTGNPPCCDVKDGVQVNSIVPGAVMTGRRRSFQQEYRKPVLLHDSALALSEKPVIDEGVTAKLHRGDKASLKSS